MNGKAARRIRLAAAVMDMSVKQLKKEYKAKPYHRRRIAGVKIAPHHEAIRRSRALLWEWAKVMR